MKNAIHLLMLIILETILTHVFTIPGKIALLSYVKHVYVQSLK